MSNTRIERNEAYTAMVVGNEELVRSVLVRGSQVLDQPTRFKEVKRYLPSRQDKFDFRDGLTLDGVNAAARVRGHFGYLGEFQSFVGDFLKGQISREW